MRRRVIESIKRDVKMIIRVKQDNTVCQTGVISLRLQGKRNFPENVQKKNNNGQMCPVVLKFLNVIV